jgi:hypothetical protein
MKTFKKMIATLLPKVVAETKTEEMPKCETDTENVPVKAEAVEDKKETDNAKAEEMEGHSDEYVKAYALGYHAAKSEANEKDEAEDKKETDKAEETVEKEGEKTGADKAETVDDKKEVEDKKEETKEKAFVNMSPAEKVLAKFGNANTKSEDKKERAVVTPLSEIFCGKKTSNKFYEMMVEARAEVDTKI